MKTCVKWTLRTFAGLVLVVAIIFGVLSQSKTLRLKLMKIGLKQMSKPKNLEKKAEYCKLFSEGVHGVVVDLGCGGGGLLNCWDSQIPVTKYVGVDPNIYAHELVEKKIEERNLTFDFELKEDISLVESERVDFVLTSLTMCSIDDIKSIADQIRRILKPGGKFVFFEHVADRNFGLRRLTQFFLYPIFRVVGDGCNVHKDTGGFVDEFFGLSDKENESFQEIMLEYSVVEWMPYPARAVLRGILEKN